MKITMRKILLFLSLVVTLFANAANIGDTFKQDGINYQVTGLDPAIVRIIPLTDGYDYSGDIIIPAAVNYNGHVFQVNGYMQYGFEDSPQLTSLTLRGDFTTTLGVFLGHSPKLEKIVLPKSMISRYETNYFNAVHIYSGKVLSMTMHTDGNETVYTISVNGIYMADGTPAKLYVEAGGGQKVYADAEGKIELRTTELPVMYDVVSIDGRYDTMKVQLLCDIEGEELIFELSAPQYNGIRFADSTYDYMLCDDYAVLMGFKDHYIGSSRTLNIPETISYQGKQYSVTRIAANAFRGEKIDIASFGKIEIIGGGCFEYVDFTSTELTIPGTVEIMYKDVFNYSNLLSVNFANSAPLTYDSFTGSNLCSYKDVKLLSTGVSFTVVSNFYKDGKKVQISLRFPNNKVVTPDDDGMVSVAEEYFVGYAGKSDIVRVFGAGLPSSLMTMNVTLESPEGELPYIYILGDVTGWNVPNDPTSGFSTENAFKRITEDNAGFYESYKLNLVQPGSDLYAGTFYFPATSICHDDPEDYHGYSTQFYFSTELKDWFDSRILSSNDTHYYIELIGTNVDSQPIVNAGGLSPWGIKLEETTPVTIVVRDVYNNQEKYDMYVREGIYDVTAQMNNLGYYEPMFIASEAGVDDAAITDRYEYAPVEFFNLQGVQVAEPTAGIYIRRQGNKVDKVLIR